MIGNSPGGKMSKNGITLFTLFFLVFLLNCDKMPCEVVVNKIPLKLKKVYSSESMHRIQGFVQNDCLSLNQKKHVGVFDINDFYAIDPVTYKMVDYIDLNWGKGVSRLRPVLAEDKIDGKCCFIAAGRSGRRVIKNLEKQRVWSLKEGLHNTKIIVVDLNGDGSPELYTGEGETLSSYTLQGQIRWRKHIKAKDIGLSQQDGVKHLLTLGNDSNINLFDYEGNLVDQRQIQKNIEGIEPIFLDGVYYHAAYSKNELFIFNPNLEPIYRYHFPYSIYRLRAIPVEWDGVTYFAILVDFSVGVNKSVLSIMSPKDKELKYLEVVKATLGVGKYRDPKTHQYNLMVGDGIGKIKIYEKP